MNDGALQLLRLAFEGEEELLSDDQLLSAFLARRDERAFTALVRRHGRMVMGVCRRILGHAEDTEDAFQAVFLVLARKAATIRPRGLVGNWLYGVASRTAQKARTVRARRRAGEKRACAMARAEVPSEHLWDQLAPHLDRELECLPEIYRAAIVLCDLEGATRKEAAHKLGWTEGTLSGRLARARALLARRLSRRGLALSAGTLTALLSARMTEAAFLPGALVTTTTKAALLGAAGGSAINGLVSAKAVALAERVVKAMFLAKLRTLTCVLLGLGVIGVGFSLIPEPVQAQKPVTVIGQSPEKSSKEAADVLAELGKAQIEAAEANVLIAEAQAEEARFAIEGAEIELKIRQALRDRKAGLIKTASISHDELTTAEYDVEKARHDVEAKKVALKVAQARVMAAKSQVKVVMAQTKAAALQR